MFGPGFDEFESMLPRMQQLAQQIVDSYGPDVNPEELPANKEIQGMMERAKDLLIGELQALEKKAKEGSMELLNAAAVLPGAAAAFAAVAPMFEKAGVKMPEAREPKPPEPEKPLLAIDFEEKHCPAAAPQLVASLLDLAEGVHQPPRPPTKPFPRELVKVPLPKAMEIRKAYRLRSAGLVLLSSDHTPLQFLDRLVVKPDTHLDAIDFLARALPRREAVWWGALCVWLTSEGKLAMPELELMKAAARWVLEPGESGRVLVQDALANVELASPLGYLGNAVTQTGPFVPYPGGAPIDPLPTACADSVAGGLHLAAVSGDATKVMARYQDYTALGIGVGRGKHSWIRPKPASREDQALWPGHTW